MLNPITAYVYIDLITIPMFLFLLTSGAFILATNEQNTADSVTKINKKLDEQTKITKEIKKLIKNKFK